MNDASDPLPPMPGILPEVGLVYCAGNPAIYRRMLVRFRDAKAGAAGEIRRALAAGDRVLAGRAAHSLKSTALAIGAVGLSDAARDLEEILVEGGDPGGALAAFEARLDEVTGGLRFLQQGP
jgi:two-component system, sensor histidine kinase and response regulator